MESILGEYEGYLTRRKMVPPRQVPFFVNWLKQYLAFEQRHDGEPFESVLDQFASHLEKNERIKD